MNLKRIFRGPLIWIVLAVVAVGLLIDFSTRLSGAQQATIESALSGYNWPEPATE